MRPIVRSGSFSSILACPQHVRLGVNLGNADCPVLPLEGVGLDVIQTARGRTLRASDAEQHDRALRSLSSGAHPRDPLASPGERCATSGTREELALAPVICPSGSFVSSPLCKNISLHPSGKSSLQLRASHPTEGRIAIVTDAGCGCGGRGSVRRET